MKHSGGTVIKNIRSGWYIEGNSSVGSHPRLEKM